MGWPTSPPSVLRRGTLAGTAMRPSATSRRLRLRQTVPSCLRIEHTTLRARTRKLKSVADRSRRRLQGKGRVSRTSPHGRAIRSPALEVDPMDSHELKQLLRDVRDGRLGAGRGGAPDPRAPVPGRRRVRQGRPPPPAALRVPRGHLRAGEDGRADRGHPADAAGATSRAGWSRGSIPQAAEHLHGRVPRGRAQRRRPDLPGPRAGRRRARSWAGSSS